MCITPARDHGSEDTRPRCTRQEPHGNINVRTEFYDDTSVLSSSRTPPELSAIALGDRPSTERPRHDERARRAIRRNQRRTAATRRVHGTLPRVIGRAGDAPRRSRQDLIHFWPIRFRSAHWRIFRATAPTPFMARMTQIARKIAGRCRRGRDGTPLARRFTRTGRVFRTRALRATPPDALAS